MNKYFLFGRGAVILLEEQGIEAFADSTIPFSTFEWKDGKTDPVDLLMAFDGWEDYAVITEDEYEYIVNL
jgi:hypothetical protein